MIQKAKVQWGVEADENSKFFHTLANKKPKAYWRLKGLN